MYEILRVPHQIDQFMKAFNMMIAYSQPPIYKYDFKEFYRLVKEVYMISDGCSYLGAGAILHKEYKNFELPYIFRAYGNNVYELWAVDFDKQDSYKKYYDLIKTLIKDNNDRLIFCESIPNNNKALLNALKNNRFRPNKANDRKDYTQTLFYTPIYSKLIEDELFKINPRDDLHTIDKMNTFECEDHKIKEAQDKYTQELIEKNLSEISYEVNDDCCCNQGQTEEEFLNEQSCCCCPNMINIPIDYSKVDYIGGSENTVEFCDKKSCEGCMYDKVRPDKLPYFCQSNWLKNHTNPIWTANENNCKCDGK